MNPVRPPVHPPAPPASQGPGAVKSAAQRAFFEAALGKATGAPQAVAETPATPVQPQPVQWTRVDQPTEPPQKILRPGSLLDIRV